MVSIDEKLKRMPQTIRVGSRAGGLSEFLSIQAAINYCDAQGGDWVIEIYPQGPVGYNEGDITPNGGANITLQGMGVERVVITPVAVPAAAVIVSGFTLTLNNLIVVAPTNARPALRVTGGDCHVASSTLAGVGVGDAVQQIGGNLTIDACRVGQDIDLSTAQCNLEINYSLLGGPIDTAGAFDHALAFQDCDFNTQNLNSLATGIVTLDMDGCSNVGTVINAGTGSFNIRRSDINTVSVTNAAGSITSYGGTILNWGGTTGTILWYETTGLMRVLPRGILDNINIEAAIAALPASGGIVQLAAGAFSIANDIDMVGNAMLAGAGMGATVLTLTALTDENVITAISVNNVVIKDLTVDGNRLNNIDHGGATDALQNGIYFRDVTNGKVIRVKAKSAIYHGVFFYYSLNCELLESVLTDNKYRGIHAHSGDTYDGITPARGHHIISRNYFADNLVADVFVGWLEPGDKVVNNVFNSSVPTSGCVAIEGVQNSVGYRGRDSLYEGNYFHYTGNAAPGAVYFVYPYYVSFVNNIIVCTQAKPGIYAALGPSTQPATVVDISHNIITSAGKGISAPAAAGDNYNTQCIVSHNDIVAAGIGIEWRGITSYLKMEGNNVLSSGDVGVYADFGSATIDTESSFSNNTVRVSSDGFRAVYIAAMSYSKVDGNVIMVPSTGNVIAIQLDNFDLSSFTNNHISGGDTIFLVYVGPSQSVYSEFSNNYLTGYAGMWLDNVDACLVKGNFFQTDGDLQIDADCDSDLIESNLSHSEFKITNSGTNIIFRNNHHYVDHGESRFASGVLVAGVANAIGFAWHNPEYGDILVKKVVIEVTTGGGTVGSHLDVGIADDAAGTNRGTEFFDDLLLNNIKVNDSWVAGDGGTQTKWVFCQDNAPVTDGWIVGQILDANAAALVGRFYIEYVGR